MVESLKYMKAKKDRLQILVESIMIEPIPEEGQLINPFKAKKRGTKQVTLDEMVVKKPASQLPDKIEDWTGKNFASYFAKSYQNTTGGNYKITFTSDLPLIKQIGDFFESHSLPRNEVTKTFIDWSMKNYDNIVKKYGYFTLTSVFNSVNYFYQDHFLAQRTDNSDTQKTLLDEIKQVESEGQVTEIFARFGIPLTVNYLINIKKYPSEKVDGAVSKLLNSLHSSTTVQSQNTLERIFKASVINSPYPKEFISLDWRIKYNNYINNFLSESWWRDDDYTGSFSMSYNFLKGGD